MLNLFLLTMTVFLLAFAGLAVGLFFRRGGIRRSCGSSGTACRCKTQQTPSDCDCG